MPDDPAPLPAEPPAPAPVAAPVPAPERLRSLDTLRGVAVLGILSVNIVTFGLPMSATTNPAVFGEMSPPNVVAWFISYVLCDGKFRAIFAMLFGAGAVLLLDRADRRGAGIRAADVYYRRTLWLVFFGLLHAYLVWWGDILFWFGVFGLALFPFRNWSPALLIAAGVLLLHLSIPMAVIEHVELKAMRDRSLALAAEAAQGRTLTEDEQTAWWAWELKKRELNPPGKDLAREIEAQRAGWWTNFVRRADMAARMQSVGVYRYGLTDVGALMLVGMGLLKLGVFSGERSARFYRRLVLAGYGIGLPLETYVGIEGMVAQFDVLEHGLLHQCTYPVGRLAVALGHVGVVMLVCRTGWLRWPTALLANVGRMALTNYLLQSILCTAYFDGWGLGRFAALQRYELLYVVLAVWVFQLVFSTIWLSLFRFGPVEWVWRALTYGQWPGAAERPTPRPRTKPEEIGVPTGDSSTRTVLFLCTGNYYRSRHAEAVFNHEALAAGLPWRAVSRGLALEFGVDNIGPMSRATQARLAALGIAHEPYLRLPLHATEEDLSAAELVVALKEEEHRPLMTERFPTWVDGVEYWMVHDLDVAGPEMALPQIEQHVRELVARLAAS
jgi:uncharacterized protein